MESFKQVVYNRRNFLKVAGGAVGTSMVPEWARGQTPPVVNTRQDVSTLAANSPTIQTLSSAISYFKSLAAKNTASMYNWQSLAAIHYNSCPHTNWFFLPWHRPYCGYFEWLIQKYTQTPTFALPYWNWTKNPQIPAVFSNPASPLYDSSRQVSPTAQASSNWVGPTVMANILGTADFQSFASSKVTSQRANGSTGALEATPHNHIHDWINGDMETFYSPLDPLFWMHHGNIDRLWVVWNQKYANTTDSSWLNFTMTYNGPNANVGNWTVTQTLSTKAMGYTYDNVTSVS